MGLLRFDHLCDGEFLAMVKLAPRIPLRDSMLFLRTAEEMNGVPQSEDGKITGTDRNKLDNN